MNTTPSRVRLTISVTPEVFEIYSRLAIAGNASLGRTMGDWLGDTAEAAAFTAQTLEKARQAPRDAIRQINLLTASLVAENDALTSAIEARQAAAVRADRREHAPRKLVVPPSCNTGGKGTPTQGKTSRGAKS